MTGRRTIRPVGFTIDELNQTERELTRAIEDLDVEDILTVRLARVLSNKMGDLRAIVRAQDWLERHNFIELSED